MTTARWNCWTSWSETQWAVLATSSICLTLRANGWLRAPGQGQ